MSESIKVKLKIEGLHCTSCAFLIDGELEDLEGVKSAKTNYAKQECELEFDVEKADIDNIIRVVERTGYKAWIKT